MRTNHHVLTIEGPGGSSGSNQAPLIALTPPILVSPIDIQHIIVGFSEEMINKLNFQPCTTELLESFLIHEQTGIENDVVEEDARIIREEDMGSPKKAHTVEAVHLEQQHEKAVHVETTKNQGNLETTKSLSASKLNEPNSVLNAPEKGINLGSNEDAKLATSIGEVIPKDPMTQKEVQERNGKENAIFVIENAQKEG